MSSQETSLFHFPSNQEASIDILFEYQSSINVGDQLFVDYGEGWFEERGMVEQREEIDALLEDPPEKPSQQADGVSKQNLLLASLPRLPGCHSRYVIFQENHLIAKKNITTGVVLETSRVILVADSQRLRSYRGPFTDILWWWERRRQEETADDAIVTSKTGEVVSRSSFSNTSIPLLLSGYGAFYGVAEEENNEVGNVEAIFLEETEATPMLIQFKTLRRILKGESFIIKNSKRDNFRFLVQQL